METDTRIRPGSMWNGHKLKKVAAHTSLNDTEEALDLSKSGSCATVCRTPTKRSPPGTADFGRQTVERFYWADGTMKSERHFVNNVIQGLTRRWYINGNIEFMGFYRNGFPHGAHRSFYEYCPGSAHYECTWDDGIQNGYETWFFEGGELLRARLWVRGRLEGIECRWNYKGDMFDWCMWDSGEPVAEDIPPIPPCPPRLPLPAYISGVTKRLTPPLLPSLANSNSGDIVVPQRD
jgi:hypothetical protein